MVHLGNNSFVKNQLSLCGISQPVVFVLILHLSVALIFSDSIMSSVFILGLIVAVSIRFHSFHYLIVTTLRRFKLFIFIVCLCSFLKDFSMTVEVVQTCLKVVDLLLLGICFHYFCDVVYLLDFTDYLLNDIKYLNLSISEAS